MNTKPETIQTILHYYEFDTNDKWSGAAYTAMCEALNDLGIKADRVLEIQAAQFFQKEKIKPLNRTAVLLETKCLFSNQWNTAPTVTSEIGLRLHDWSELIYQNQSMKIGYWLEQTNDMREVRALTYKCGYCGANYFKPDFSFCTACIGSEYLTEDRLPLLFLTPVGIDKQNYDGVNLPDDFVKQFREKHAETMTAKLEKRKIDKLAQIRQNIESAEIEYAGFSMLVPIGIDFENVIYYPHTGKFSFGWRQVIPENDRASIVEKLKECGFADRYAYEFHS